MVKSKNGGTGLTIQLLLLDCAGQGRYLCCDAPARQARQIKIEYATPGAAFFFPTGRIGRRFFALALGISVFVLGNVWWGFFGGLAGGMCGTAAAGALHPGRTMRGGNGNALERRTGFPVGNVHK